MLCWTFEIWFIPFDAFSVALFLSWARQRAAEAEQSMNPTMLGCIAGSILMRKAASLAFEDKRRSTLTSDIIECLGRRWMGCITSITFICKCSRTNTLFACLQFGRYLPSQLIMAEWNYCLDINYFSRHHLSIFTNFPLVLYLMASLF